MNMVIIKIANIPHAIQRILYVLYVCTIVGAYVCVPQTIGYCRQVDVFCVL